MRNSRDMKIGRRPWRLVGLVSVVVTAMFVVVGCSTLSSSDGPPLVATGSTDKPDAVPKAEPRSRYGNPASYEVFGKRYQTMREARGFVERGDASWYGKKFHGRRTSNGETYDMYAMTAAHKNLPLPSYVEVKNLNNGRVIVVRVNDRGPFHAGRIIDLSYTAATKLDIVRSGTAPVEIRVITPGAEAARPGPAAVRAAPVVTAAASDVRSQTFVQSGAFVDELNAKQHAKRVAAVVGRSVSVVPTQRGTQTLYLVRNGPMASQAAAQALRDQLLAAGISANMVLAQ